MSDCNHWFLGACPACVSKLERRIKELEAQKRGQVSVPVEPPIELLRSMALRFDHALGVPGYYDQPMFVNGPSHQQRYDSAITVMRQLYEEVVGEGFYSQRFRAI